jgi:predicted TIM-barrel fold metal-dependent hydrolase
VRILDSHCHAWRRWPYLPVVPDEATRGTADQLLYELDANGVEQALVVCAAIEKNPDNIEYVASARDRHPARLRLVADLDCTWSANYHVPGSAGRLQHLDDRYRLTGFAHYLADDNDGWLRSDEADELFAAAAERHLIVSLGATTDWQADLRALAERHPSVPILCQTLGGVRADEGVDSPGLAEVLASADVPNIHIKVAGFHYASARGWDYPWSDSIAVLAHIAEAFGPERLCFGSDFPASTRFCTFRQTLAAVQEHCAFFGPQDLALVLGGTLGRLLDEHDASRVGERPRG